MPNTRERIVVLEGIDEADVVVREPAAELEYAPVGWRRGAWEDERSAGAVAAEYTPPRHGRAA